MPSRRRLLQTLTIFFLIGLVQNLPLPQLGQAALVRAGTEYRHLRIKAPNWGGRCNPWNLPDGACLQIVDEAVVFASCRDHFARRWRYDDAASQLHYRTTPGDDEQSFIALNETILGLADCDATTSRWHHDPTSGHLQ